MKEENKVAANKKLNIQSFANASDELLNITQGISQQGIQSLYNKLHMYLENDLKYAIRNTAEIEEILRENWSGTDCDIFIENFNKLGNDILKKISEYDEAIKVEFNKIIDEWHDFQMSNIIRR